jgi:hypothetical protein
VRYTELSPTPSLRGAAARAPATVVGADHAQVETEGFARSARQIDHRPSGRCHQREGCARCLFGAPSLTQRALATLAMVGCPGP